MFISFKALIGTQNLVTTNKQSGKSGAGLGMHYPNEITVITLRN